MENSMSEQHEALDVGNLINESSHFDDLRSIGFKYRNTDEGKAYNEARFAHLSKVAGEYMGNFSEMNEDGYLVDSEGNADVHITQIDDMPTEELFYAEYKNSLAADA